MLLSSLRKINQFSPFLLGTKCIINNYSIYDAAMFTNSGNRHLRNRAQVFDDINANKTPDYWNYDDLQITWGEQENYIVSKKLGRGKYSDVFEGTNAQNSQKCVVKVLKPVKQRKIKREIKILQNVCGGPNIVQLLDVVRDPQSKTPSLILEYVDNVDYKVLYPQLSDYDTRFYLYKILVALQFAHSNGIMHRDIKPGNIMIDPKQRKLRVIDWGLAEFYHPTQNYHVRVASRFYKGPELLVDLNDYDYSLDLWSLGCTMAGMIFKKDPFFRGIDNDDQLVKIAKILGTEKLYDYINKYGLTPNTQIMSRIGKKKAVPWDSMRNKNTPFATDEAINLLDSLLQYDQSERLTAAQALEHPYFDPVREEGQTVI